MLNKDTFLLSNDQMTHFSDGIKPLRLIRTRQPPFDLKEGFLTFENALLVNVISSLQG